MKHLNIAMKLILAIVIVSTFSFCNNEQPPANTGNEKVIIDTNLLKREPVNPYAAVDLSPMDMIYFPENFSKKKMEKLVSGKPKARVIYSRPHRQDRKVFGGLVKWGEAWRLGANEATEMELFENITIKGKQIPAGRYSLYAIPYEDRWTVVFNSEIFIWGLKFDPAKDVARIDVPVNTKNQLIEYFTMVFENTDSGADLVMAWESTEVRLAIEF